MSNLNRTPFKINLIKMAFVSVLVKKVVYAVVLAMEVLTNPALLICVIMMAGLFPETILRVWATLKYSLYPSDVPLKFNVMLDSLVTYHQVWHHIQENRIWIMVATLALLGLRKLVKMLKAEVLVALHNIKVQVPEVEVNEDEKPLPAKVILTTELTPKQPVAERMVVGSPLCNAETPRIQVSILVAKGGDPKLYYAGVGFRTMDRLVTAMHVVSDATEIVVESNNGTRMNINPDDFVETYVDLTWVELTPAQWQKLGTASAKLALTVPSYQWVQVAAQGKVTFGNLEPVDAMGMIKYSGSTVHGFSGSPYHINKLVYGVHVGAGNTDNFGYSASFLAALIRRHSRAPGIVSNEDSAEYLCGQFERFGMDTFDYEISPVDRDSYTIKVAGSYHNVDSEVFDKLLRKYNANRARGMVYEEESARADQSFLEKVSPPEMEKPPLVPEEILKPPKVEQVPETSRGFAIFPESVIASTSQETGSPTDQKDEKDVLIKSLLKQNEQMLASLTRMANSGSDSRPSMPARQKGPSPTTSQNSTKPKKATPAQRAQQWKTQYELLRAALLQGDPNQIQELTRQSPMPSSGLRIGVATSQQQVQPMNSSN